MILCELWKLPNVAATLMGPGGGGKDTQAELLSQSPMGTEFSVLVPASEMLKGRARREDEVGRIILQKMAERVLVPNDIMRRVFFDFIRRMLGPIPEKLAKLPKLFLNGVPRNIAQDIEYRQGLSEYGYEHLVYVDLQHFTGDKRADDEMREELTRRMLLRKGREKAREEALTRLRVFDEETAPLIAQVRADARISAKNNRGVRIHYVPIAVGMASPEAVHKKIVTALHENVLTSLVPAFA